MKLFFSVLLPVCVIGCQDGWVSFNGYCYYRVQKNIHIKSTDYYCQGWGANAVSITSEDEKNFVMNLTRSGFALPLWLQTSIGAYRDSKHGPWKWHDGSPFKQEYLFMRKQEDNELCAYLIADNVVHHKHRGSTNPSQFWFNGRIGGFVAGYCTNNGMTTICKKKDTTGGRTQNMCGSEWIALNSNCYKKFSKPSIRINEADDHCKLFGSRLASLTTQEEVYLAIRMTRIGDSKQINWQTAIGCYRDSPMDPWKWRDGTEFNQNGRFYLQQNDTDNCCLLFSDVGAAIGKSYLPSDKDVYFHRLWGRFFKAPCSFPAFQFVCKKKACDLNVSTFSNGKCTCKTGFMDITKTSLLEAENYKEGGKCVPNQCHLMKDTTILFIIDSSDSITKKRWPKMLDFVESAADKLPTKFRVGFMKFSTKISFDDFVEPGWDAREFKRAIPIKYDAGNTDTPAALKKAKEIFAGTRSKNKIAVLITDGLPFADEYDDQELALNATVKASEELRKDRIRLAVMGVGPKICDNAAQVKQWVRNPKRDYFLLSHNVDTLKGSDMDKLLNMICYTKKR